MAEGSAIRSSEAIRLVARRELRERLRARSFVVSTALLVAIVLVAGVIARLASDDEPDTIRVGVVASQRGSIETAVAEAAQPYDREATVAFVGDAATARASLEAGDVDVVVLPDEREVAFADDVDDEVVAIVQQAWARVAVVDQLAEAGLSEEAIDLALTVEPLAVVSLDTDDGPSGIGLLTGTLSAILLFVSLQTFGTYVLTGVVEEKSSAVVEILLVRARADQLLAGKVIGIGTAALLQFGAAVAAGLASLALSDVSVPGEVWSAVPMMLVWFLGGFALYSTLFALAGSLVSRQEDAQSAAAPIGYGLVAAYLLVFVFGSVPDSTASTVLSLVPPIAPLLMPIRMATGAASVLEIVVALVGLVLATYAAWKLAGRIYQQVLLRRGSRIAWREALSLARN